MRFQQMLMPSCAVVVVIFTANDGAADHSAYAGRREIQVERSGITCKHRHDWSRTTERARLRMISGNQDPFGGDNDYASVECKRTAEGTPLFKAPSPAFTSMWLSPDGRYLVGLSNVMVTNPYQLVVYRTDGTLVYRKHVAAFEACVDLTEFIKFYREHSGSQALLKERSIVRGATVYVDYDFVNAPIRFGRETWLALDEKRCRSHLSANISQTVTNWVYWYRESDPGIALDRDERGVAIGLTVLDRVGVPIRISLVPEEPLVRDVQNLGTTCD